MPVRAGLPFVLTAVFSLAPLAAARASAPAGPAPGVWRLPGAACPMSFQVLDDGRVVRTTGTLRYTTKAVFEPSAANHGWALDETLESANNGKSCRGETIERVREHLAQRAYVRVLGDTLFYEGGGGSLQMRRADAPGALGPR